mmetsp:Transcript_41249/g.124727  ORF Transcript_41249/g.124727 Transcript_41249/m.124727 type:complete len:211 (+) Transcript_41249:2296-2928(+)
MGLGRGFRAHLSGEVALRGGEEGEGRLEARGQGRRLRRRRVGSLRGLGGHLGLRRSGGLLLRGRRLLLRPRRLLLGIRRLLLGLRRCLHLGLRRHCFLLRLRRRCLLLRLLGLLSLLLGLGFRRLLRHLLDRRRRHCRRLTVPVVGRLIGRWRVRVLLIRPVPHLLRILGNGAHEASSEIRLLLQLGFCEGRLGNVLRTVAALGHGLVWC